MSLFTRVGLVGIILLVVMSLIKVNASERVLAENQILFKQTATPADRVAFTKWLQDANLITIGVNERGDKEPGITIEHYAGVVFGTAQQEKLLGLVSEEYRQSIAYRTRVIQEATFERESSYIDKNGQTRRVIPLGEFYRKTQSPEGLLVPSDKLKVSTPVVSAQEKVQLTISELADKVSALQGQVIATQSAEIAIGNLADKVLTATQRADASSDAIKNLQEDSKLVWDQVLAGGTVSARNSELLTAISSGLSDLDREFEKLEAAAQIAAAERAVLKRAVVEGNQRSVDFKVETQATFDEINQKLETEVATIGDQIITNRLLTDQRITSEVGELRNQVIGDMLQANEKLNANIEIINTNFKNTWMVNGLFSLAILALIIGLVLFVNRKMKNIIKAIMRKTAKINKNVAQVREEATEANQTSKLLLKEKMMKVNFSKGSPVVENLMKVDFPEFQSSIDSLRISCDYRGKHYVIQLWRADGVSKDRVNINCKRAVDNKLFVDPVMLINVEDSIRKAVVTGRAEERAASVDKMAA